jgi:hypothetical protein
MPHLHHNYYCSTTIPTLDLPSIPFLNRYAFDTTTPLIHLQPPCMKRKTKSCLIDTATISSTQQKTSKLPMTSVEIGTLKEIEDDVIAAVSERKGQVLEVYPSVSEA